jgi:DMSO/TMAO reductase YedYZ molybdopterin-dependent catalytic subunit
MGISLEELQLAARNHGMPLEALRYPLTPAGLHYLLIHYDIPAVDPETWRLDVRGERRLSLSVADLRARPVADLAATMECAGNGRALFDPRPVSQPWLAEAVGTARWGGTPLRSLLEEAGIPSGTVDVVFRGLDVGIEGGEPPQAYARALPLAEALRDEVVLAYDMNGAPLPPQHGFPLRLVVPGWYGMTNVKWLAEIELVAEPFAGFQNTRAYLFRRTEEDEGTPVDRMQPRALMVPPGVPDFFTRRRVVPPGPCVLEGRAWSGLAPVASVDVSVDDGATWASAVLADDLGRWAWRGWTLPWDAAPGDHVLLCRARDEAGNQQPLAAEWNVGGYANNGVLRVPVTVA